MIQFGNECRCALRSQSRTVLVRPHPARSGRPRQLCPGASGIDFLFSLITPPVLPQVVFDPRRDGQLNSRDVSHLFKPTLAVTCIHPDTYLRQYVYDFIEMIAPKWTPDAVLSLWRPEKTLPVQIINAPGNLRDLAKHSETRANALLRPAFRCVRVHLSVTFGRAPFRVTSELISARCYAICNRQIHL